jgi:peroxiredoxin Q/BCP
MYPTLKQLALLYTLTATGLTLSAAEALPDFTLKSATSDASFKLSAQKGKIVVLHFLLKTECPICLRHTREYMSMAKDLPNTVQVFIKPDNDAEIRQWAGKLPPESLQQTPIYRDADGTLAKAMNIPDGYKFHGQVVHYPALVLINSKGEEVFRYVGKNNSDRYPFAQLKAKIESLNQP